MSCEINLDRCSDENQLNKHYTDVLNFDSIFRRSRLLIYDECTIQSKKNYFYFKKSALH